MSKRSKMALSGQQKDTWTFASTASSTSNYGVQGVSQLVNCGVGTEISQADVNAHRTNATNVALNAVNADTRDKDVYLHSMTNQVIIANASSDNVVIWAYDVICKTDREATLLPNTSFASGVGNVQGLDAATSSTIGTWPNLVSEFTLNWKIVKRTRIELSAGRDHTHTFTYAVNRRINHSKLLTYQMLRGVTMNTMFIHSGLPCSNDPTWANPSLITLNRTKLLYVHNRKWVTSMLNTKARKNTHQVTNLPNATAVGATVMRTIQDQSGDAEATTFA